MYIQSFKYNPKDRPLNDLTLILYVKLPDKHWSRYNMPIVDEVVVLLINGDKSPRDIVLTAGDGRLPWVSKILIPYFLLLKGSYDPLQYHLLFPIGNEGYCINIPQQNTAAWS